MLITEPMLIKFGLKSSVLSNQVSFKRFPCTYIVVMEPSSHTVHVQTLCTGRHFPDNSTTHAATHQISMKISITGPSNQLGTRPKTTPAWIAFDFHALYREQYTRGLRTTLISLFFTNARNRKKMMYLRSKWSQWNIFNGSEVHVQRSGAVGDLRILRRDTGQFEHTVNIFTVSSV